MKQGATILSIFGYIFTIPYFFVLLVTYCCADIELLNIYPFSVSVRMVKNVLIIFVWTVGEKKEGIGGLSTRLAHDSKESHNYTENGAADCGYYSDNLA